MKRGRARRGSFDELLQSELRGGKRALANFGRLLRSLKPHALALEAPRRRRDEPGAAGEEDDLAGGGGGEVDKVFCATWVDARDAVVGTKCGRLLRMAPHAEVATQRPTIAEIRLPRNAHAPAAARREEAGGIHDVAMNPSRTLMASAGVGRRPETVGLFRAEDMEPLTACGPSDGSHHDWVFAVSWVNDHVMVSASRDGSIHVREVPESLRASAGSSSRPEQGTVGLSTLSRNPAAHGGAKVRDCKTFASQSGDRSRLVSIAPEAVEPDKNVLLWDVVNGVSFRVAALSAEAVPPARELAPCLATHNEDENIFGLGVRAEVRTFDARSLRSPAIVHAVDDASDGPLRSLSIRGHFMTCGWALGNLSIVDLRKPDAALPFRFEAPASVFTHAWDHAGSSLLLAGGALTYMDNGSYVTLLSAT